MAPSTLSTLLADNAFCVSRQPRCERMFPERFRKRDFLQGNFSIGEFGGRAALDPPIWDELRSGTARVRPQFKKSRKESQKRIKSESKYNIQVLDISFYG